MAVFVLYEWEKTEIVGLYKSRFHTMQSLANYYNVSTSTIRSVLVERKVIKPKPVLSVDQHKMLALLNKNNISYYKLNQILRGNKYVG